MTLHPAHTGQPGRSETTRSTSQPTRNRQVDVAAIRRDYPIEDVVAAAGIELRPAGHGFVGRCPFHDDTTPSMSVAGVPDRFTCFGCGAHGDVIDFVQRLHHVTFIEAIHTLTADNPFPTPSGIHRTPARTASSARPPLVPRSLRHRCHRRAGLRHQRARLAAPVRAGPRQFRRAVPAAPPRDRPTPAARRAARGTARQLQGNHPGQPLVGYAGHGWTTLVDALRRDGVTAHELTVMDLGQRTRDDRLIDTLRDRIIVPVLDADHRIRGFIGRDISGNPRAPKYRNPTHTPTFDKSQILYRPTHHALDPGGTVVIVEGVLDALAIAAAAAAAGRSRQIAPCAANGVTVSPAQVDHILGLAREARCVIALDGDQAGRDGTRRWLHELTIRHGRVAYVTTLPAGDDPADWLRHNADGLAAFDPSTTGPPWRSAVPVVPGRELTRLAIETTGPGATTAPANGVVDGPDHRRHRVPATHPPSARSCRPPQPDSCSSSPSPR